MTIKAFIFDLDGTILHTLPDLAVAANEALRQMGLPTRSYEEIQSFMGDGGARMIGRAVPPGTPDDLRWQVFDRWRAIYIASDYANTTPFPGVVDALRELRERGVKTGVLSNKFDEGTRVLTQRFFPGLFDAVRGDKPPAPRKPDPTTLLEMLEQLGARPEDAAYVGDSLVDVQVAHNAGVLAVGVSWGYDAVSPLPIEQLDAYIHDPLELQNL